jgi:hypothetical protein
LCPASLPQTKPCWIAWLLQYLLVVVLLLMMQLLLSLLWLQQSMRSCVHVVIVF